MSCLACLFLCRHILRGYHIICRFFVLVVRPLEFRVSYRDAVLLLRSTTSTARLLRVDVPASCVCVATRRCYVVLAVSQSWTAVFAVLLVERNRSVPSHRGCWFKHFNMCAYSTPIPPWSWCGPYSVCLRVTTSFLFVCRFQDWVSCGMPAGAVRVKGVLAFDEDRLTRCVRSCKIFVIYSTYVRVSFTSRTSALCLP